MSLYLTAPPLAAFVLFLVLAVLVLNRDHRTARYRLFALFLFSMGLWGLIIYGMRVSPTAADALIWRRALPAVGLVGGVAFLHFSVLHTRALPRPRLIPIAYLCVAVVAGLSFTDLLVSGMTTDRYGYLPIPGPLSNLVSGLSYVFLFLGLVNFIRAYRRSSLYTERNSYVYFFAGISCSMLGGAVDYASLTGLVPPLGLIGNMLFGALTTVAILRYRLMDVHLVFRKGLSYVLLSSAVALPYVGIIILSNRLFGFGSVSLWSSLLLLLVLAIFLQPFWQTIQRIVDRLFFRERFSFLQKLEEFGQEAHDIRDLRQLASSLVDLMSQALQAPTIYLLLRSESGSFRSVSATGGSHVILGAESPLVKCLRTAGRLLYRRDLNIVPQLQSLPAKELGQLEEMGAALFVPLRTKEDDLIGIFILGQNASRQPYSAGDEQLVLTVASRMAIELENARLYALEQSMRRELERQDEIKTEFLHTVAHELKTPLTAIASSSDLMTGEAALTTPEQRERLVHNINRSAWLMDRRVSELLDMAKIRMGGLQLHRQPEDIGRLIAEVASQLQTLFKNKRQSLQLQVPDALPPVSLDRDRIEQVLFNLMSNANKFSGTGTRIFVRASNADGETVVEVRDAAPAVTSADRVRLFDAYYRGGSAERRRVPGLGLGLTISKRIIELHGGRIWVESTGKEGNAFGFSLPTLAAQPGDAEQPGEPQETMEAELEGTHHRR